MTNNVKTNPDHLRTAEAIEHLITQTVEEGGDVRSVASSLFVQGCELFRVAHGFHGPDGLGRALDKMKAYAESHQAAVDEVARHGQSGRA
ncbi:hypothetical protein [Marimonas lutisalis]|uniref:hypothetical protein n=1 Tax=Marimonas lutisalis TaxID=2545756 RepID=UPI0010F5CBF8|nr:hypothetical protein [Marimonas lutisalis]